MILAGRFLTRAHGAYRERRESAKRAQPSYNRASNNNFGVRMRLASLCLLGSIAASVASVSGAQDFPKTSPIWSTKPDVAAFEALQQRETDLRVGRD